MHRAPRCFVLTLAGFGSKAGLLPLHAWLPRAHPEAPSQVSALMSAAMVNLGVYGIVRVGLQLLGGGPALVGRDAAGRGRGVRGVRDPAGGGGTDLKRLLAYSTTENMGLIVLAVGAARLFAASGRHAAAAIAMAAALLHLVGHAAFKTLLFLAAGSVLAATGLRDLDRLGGWPAGCRAPRCCSGSARSARPRCRWAPAFVSEWLLLQALIHAGREHDTAGGARDAARGRRGRAHAGLAVATFVKAFGVGFLARPRSEPAADAREAPASMLAGMARRGGRPASCWRWRPLVVAPALRRVLASCPRPATRTCVTDLATVLRLPGVAGSIAPLRDRGGPGRGRAGRGRPGAVAVAAAPGPGASPLWACGADALTARMEYTATSFAEPLQRVFDDVLRPDTDVDVTHYRRVAATWSRGHLPAPGSPTRSRTGSTRRCSGRVTAAARSWSGAPTPAACTATSPTALLRRADRAGGDPMNVVSYVAGAAQIGAVDRSARRC